MRFFRTTNRSACSRIPRSAVATCARWHGFHNPLQCLLSVGRRRDNRSLRSLANVVFMFTPYDQSKFRESEELYFTFRWNFGYYSGHLSNDLRVYQVPRLTPKARRKFDDEQLNQRMIPRSKSTGSADSFLLASWWLHCGRFWAPARDIPARLLHIRPDANSIIRICDVIAHMPE
jgi:hypothetical protein